MVIAARLSKIRQTWFQPWDRSCVERRGRLKLCSHALLMDDLSTEFFVLFLGNPLRTEGLQRAESGTTGPNRVVSIRRSDNVDGGVGFSSKLLLQSLGQAFEQRGATREDDVSVQV